MENLTEKNEEKSALTVPQIDKKKLRKRLFVDYNLIKPKMPKKMMSNMQTQIWCPCNF